jgi:hypothetical protein
MFNSLEMASVSQYGIGKQNPLESHRRAGLLFERALRQGKARRLWARLTGKNNSLGDFIQCGLSAERRPALGAGVVNVPLAQIVGSEGRVRDFDNAFRPLNDHTRDRWIGIAVARRDGVELPPVELIQVGDEYYVRDGHHRISVARAAGQAEIEARIAYAFRATAKSMSEDMERG